MKRNREFQRPATTHHRPNLSVATAANLITSLFLCLFLLWNSPSASAQMDQGTVNGTVSDQAGRIVPNATVTLTDAETGLVLTSKTDSKGFYIFSPIKIGSYSIRATASGFATTVLTGLVLNVNERLEANLTLNVGEVAQKVTVSANQEPLLQTEQASTGQVVSTREINNLPLSGRNAVFEAQLIAGVQQAYSSRGSGEGDFVANGQRPEENNFILDGVDDNSNAVDFLNGATFVIIPPPDALAEFKLQTGSYDAEFGHSAGAVLNAAVKSGTNAFHGDLWEYVRNSDLEARQEFSPSIGAYHQNQFGGTLGGPIIRNKLFFFGDVQATRIVYGAPYTGLTIPTMLMRQGNFSELLNPALTGQSEPIQLYEPGSGGGPGNQLKCNGQNNVMCPGQIDAIAQKIFNAFPTSTNNLAYDNYSVNENDIDNTTSWDGRIDWNISDKDQAFARISESLEHEYDPSPLGAMLDYPNYAGEGFGLVKGLNGVFSETHVFSPTLVNEFRLGDNAGHFDWTGLNPSVNTASSEFGMNGFPPLSPVAAGLGGMPTFFLFNSFGFSDFGTTYNYPGDEHEEVPALLDNVTKTLGTHSVRAGLYLSRVESEVFSPQFGHGNLQYNGQFTGTPGVANTGAAFADMLADSSDYATVSNSSSAATGDFLHWDIAGYVQDDWKVSRKFDLNLGVRWEYFQPYYEKDGRQANFVPLTQGVGTGTAQYLLPSGDQNRYTLYPAFTTPAAQNNISIVYDANHSLTEGQKTNFAPRFGAEYQISQKLVARAGFGMFYAGEESVGGSPALVSNYPFNFNDSFVSPSCTTPGTPCADDSITLENGFAAALPGGSLNNMAQSVTSPPLTGRDAKLKTTYSMQYNLSTEYALSNSMTTTIGYVGSLTRHLLGQVPMNIAPALAAPGTNMQPYAPFPQGYWATAQGTASYNSLQATLEKRMTKGLFFLVNYTWSHSMDDMSEPLGDATESTAGNLLLIPPKYSYANSPNDIRQKFNFSGTYNLPFGSGQEFLSHSRAENEVFGGWSITPIFTAQTGNPFTVSPANIDTPAGDTAYALLTGNPFKGGGTPNASNPTINCPSSVRNRTHWYNPCAFSNPRVWDQGSNLITNTAAALPYVGSKGDQIAGPGYWLSNVSLFKNIPTFEAQRVQLRMDVFNLFNHPSLGSPNGAINNSAGLITSTRTLGKDQPNSRFLQFAVKYYF